MDEEDCRDEQPEGMCFCGAPGVVPLRNPWLCEVHATQIMFYLLDQLCRLRDGNSWEVWRARTMPRLLAALKDMPEGHKGVRTAVN